MSVVGVDSPGFLRLAEEARGRVRRFTIEDFLARLTAGERFILLDVREDSEWAAGHLPGAHHMSRGILDRDIEAVIPERDAPIVLYCDGGHRAPLAADSLQKLGYVHVTALDEGWRGWQERGLPVVTPDAAK